MPTTCYTHVSAEDRETLSLGLAHGHSLRMMASALGRSPSTVSRESARNTAWSRPSRACTAQTQAAAQKAHQPRRKLRPVPVLLRKTLTYDRGKEMAQHEWLVQRLKIQVFFADPYSPWQRGTNENTNGLLRQYIPA